MDAKPNLNTGAISRVYAGVAGLMAFVIAIAAGWQAQNSAAHILLTAIFCMVGCYLMGTLLGAIAEHAVRVHLDRFRTERPVPEPAPAMAADAAGRR